MRQSRGCDIQKTRSLTGSHSYEATNLLRLYEYRSDGGTGIHKRLKISRPEGLAGSSPAPSTKHFNNYLQGNNMNKTFIKIITFLSCLALQGCLVDISTRDPRPRPDIPCHYDRHCPADSYCEVDGYCYDYSFYVECYSEYDCPMASYCAPNGLCYEDFYHHGQCYTHSDCPIDYFCSANGLCYYTY